MAAQPQAVTSAGLFRRRAAAAAGRRHSSREEKEARSLTTAQTAGPAWQGAWQGVGTEAVRAGQWPPLPYAMACCSVRWRWRCRCGKGRMDVWGCMAHLEGWVRGQAHKVALARAARVHAARHHRLHPPRHHVPVGALQRCPPACTGRGSGAAGSELCVGRMRRQAQAWKRLWWGTT